MRQNMFSINMDSKSVIDHENLILRRESAELSAKRQELDKLLDKALNINLKKILWRILPPYIIAGIGMLIGSIAFEAFEENGAFPIVPTAIAGILIVVGILLAFLNHKKDKAEETEKDTALEQGYDAFGDFNEQVKRDLRVPEDAVDVEVFTILYSEKDDKNEEFAYSNDTTTAFVEDGNLCFWYGEAVIGFPMSDIEALVKVNEPITFDAWMPDDPHDSFKYMQYGVELKKVDEYTEHYTMKGYYALRFAHEGTPFELLFPLYDTMPLLNLIDREVVEE